MLSVIPKQIDDESLIGYILRLTARNGFQIPLDWIGEAHLKASINYTLSAKQVNALNEFFPLTQSLGSLSTRRHSVLFHNYHTETPRICPICIRHTGYIKEEWRYIGNLKCPIHGVGLIDFCHLCNHKLEWSITLLEGICTNEMCGCFLKSEPLNNVIECLFIDEICDCLLADFVYSQPYNTYWPNLSHPDCEKLLAATSNGYDLLNGDFKRWIELYDSQNNPFNALPFKYKYFPLFHLAHSLENEWFFSEQLKNLTTSTQSPSKQPVNVGSYVVTADSAMTILGLSKDEIMNFSPEAKNKKVIPSRMRINIAPIINPTMVKK